jgi:UDP-N-acetylglucosamine 4,6-dehydratase
MQWSNLPVLVAGGSGSLGRQFTRVLLGDFHPRKLIIFSRDELKQHGMRFSGYDGPNVRYFIGDVRDVNRLPRAIQDSPWGTVFAPPARPTRNG